METKILCKNEKTRKKLLKALDELIREGVN